MVLGYRLGFYRGQGGQKAFEGGQKGSHLMKTIFLELVEHCTATSKRNLIIQHHVICHCSLVIGCYVTDGDMAPASHVKNEEGEGSHIAHLDWCGQWQWHGSSPSGQCDTSVDMACHCLSMCHHHSPMSWSNFLIIEYSCPPPESLLGVQLAGQHRTIPRVGCLL